MGAGSPRHAYPLSSKAPSRAFIPKTFQKPPPHAFSATPVIAVIPCTARQRLSLGYWSPASASSGQTHPHGKQYLTPPCIHPPTPPRAASVRLKPQHPFVGRLKRRNRAARGDSRSERCDKCPLGKKHSAILQLPYSGLESFPPPPAGSFSAADDRGASFRSFPFESNRNAVMRASSELLPSSPSCCCCRGGCSCLC